MAKYELYVILSLCRLEAINTLTHWCTRTHP